MEPLWGPVAQVLLFLPVFLFLSLLVFYLPGLILVSKTKVNFNPEETLTLSFGAGLVFFLIIAFLFAILNIRFLVPGVFILTTWYALTYLKKELFPPITQVFKRGKLISFLLLGALVEGFINFPSGFSYAAGHLYWSSQGHDGLWHIAVINALKNSLPPANPLFAGEALYNYHYFSDVVTAEFSRLFPFFSVLDLYFRYFSLLVSFLMGLAAYTFLFTWTKKRTAGYWAIFLTYFVGSFGYLVLLIQGRGFWGGETIFWAAQGNTIIGNPPHAFVYFLLPTFFIAFYHFLKNHNQYLFLLCFLLGGFLLGFKVSAAAVLLVGLGIASLVALVYRRNWSLFFLTMAIAASNLLIFKLITRGGESLLVFLPWWFVRTMIVVPDRVNWLDLELRRQFYLAKGGFRASLRIIEFETIAFFLFLLGNLGMRIIGFWEIGKIFWQKTVLKDPLVTTLFFTMLTGFLVPLFFIQKGVTYNLIQFMQYFLLIFGFFAAKSINSLLENHHRWLFKLVFIVVFVGLSIPTVVGNLVEFYGKNPLAIVSNQELEALIVLKNLSNNQDIILTKPFNPYSRGLYSSQPWPIYAWDSTGYVSAYTNRQSYYTDEGQIRILSVEGSEARLEKMNNFFEPKIPFSDKLNFLKAEKITFIYLRTEENDSFLEQEFAQMGLKKVFNNPAAVIYRL